jgi:ParB/RepB/Spo0J family partition protein
MSEEHKMFATVLLPIAKLVPMKFQSRIVEPDPERFQELVESIKQNGVLEPIIARPLHDAEGHYEIVAGTRRVKAAQKAELEMVPVHVKEVTDDKAILLQLEENLHREDYTEEDKTHTLAELAKLKGWKAKEIAENIHKSYSFVVKYLPDEFKDQPMADLGKKGGEAKAEIVATQRVPNRVTQDTIVKPKPYAIINNNIQCARCHMAFNITRMKNHNGRDLCPLCYDIEIKVPKAKEQNHAATEKPKEKWEEVKAHMSPMHSKMEDAIYTRFSTENHAVFRDVEFCIQKTVPDLYFPEKKVAVYIDGNAVHRRKRDDDARLRKKLEQYYGFHVVTVSYDTFSEKEAERVYGEIAQGMEA